MDEIPFFSSKILFPIEIIQWQSCQRRITPRNPKAIWIKKTKTLRQSQGRLGTRVEFLLGVVRTGCHVIKQCRIFDEMKPWQHQCLRRGKEPAATVVTPARLRGAILSFWGPGVGPTAIRSVLLPKASQSCWLVVLCCPFLSIWNLKGNRRLWPLASLYNPQMALCFKAYKTDRYKYFLLLTYHLFITFSFLSLKSVYLLSLLTRSSSHIDFFRSVNEVAEENELGESNNPKNLLTT